MTFPAPPVWTNVSSIFDGVNSAYVYIWISKKYRLVYVGQTNALRGTLGRARNHIGKHGTLRLRFESTVGEKLEVADDLILASYTLPRQREYLGLESSYREAIEYLVQKGLVVARTGVSPTYKLISKVRYTDRASDVVVREYAREIVNDFKANYSRASY